MSLTTIAEWVDEHWMFLAPPLSIALIVYRFVLSDNDITTLHNRQVGDAADPAKKKKQQLLRELLLWGWLALPIYSFHQFEEHGYDLYGRRYHFIEYFNATQPLGVEMTPRLLTYINLVQVHIFFGLYAWNSERSKDPLCVALTHGLMTANSVMAHLVPAMLTQKYNPGLAQSLFMAPTSIMVLRKFYEYRGGSSGDGVRSVLTCLFYGSVWGHFASLLIPLKLFTLGFLNDMGFLLWVSVMLLGFPILVGKFLSTGGESKASRKD